MTSESVLSIFKEITRIPRESGHEELIIEYLKNFASEHSLPCKVDEAGNVLISRSASKGKENVPAIVLQSHSDMVCEKTPESSHDFLKDPIRYVIENGWMIAPETTLGADDGIGIATSLAILTDKEISCGPVEALFTVSEETGLDGAMALKSGFFSARTLINLDSEDEGEIFVGCAGGLDTTAQYTVRHDDPAKYAGRQWMRLGISGCTGGHSGDDIEKGRANALQILARFLYSERALFGTLSILEGGGKRNAIARDAYAIVDTDDPDGLYAAFDTYSAAAKHCHINSDPSMEFTFSFVERVDDIMSSDDADNIIAALAQSPHGVLAMSSEIENFVETSTNLASIKKTGPDTYRVGTSQRSCIESSRREAGRKVAGNFASYGFEVAHESEYPGWAPSRNSAIRDACVEAYRTLFHTEPKVRAIHAGLECGLFTEVYPDLDMISIGPTLRGVHAPGERLDLASLDKFVELITYLIENFK
ncbi:MAG: beta-Ala-His dipeptidase [Bacteroidales bacterium]|nr:beta-Ala-His dipeptidase [Bacteroidales bacterium]